jgi:hypothetical protein
VHTNPAKELEQERVWGFDVGWRLATEDCVLKASKTSIPAPPLPSVSMIATQTDPLPTLSEPAAWAKDVPHHDLSPPSAPRASEHPIHPHSVSTSTQTELPFESSPAAGNEDLDAEVWYKPPNYLQVHHFHPRPRQQPSPVTSPTCAQKRCTLLQACSGVTSVHLVAPALACRLRAACVLLKHAFLKQLY